MIVELQGMTIIKDLALKCGAWYQVYDNKNFMVNENFDVVKFAELVVKECANIADIETRNPAGCGYITKTKGQQIKEHFGVK